MGFKVEVSIPTHLNKQVIFTLKVKKIVYPTILFNFKPFQQVSPQKHLGRMCYDTLTLDELTKAITSKVSKTIGLLAEIK